MKTFRTALKTLCFCSIACCGIALAFPKPPIDQCPLSSSYPNPPSASDYCHCFQSQATTNCKRINGTNNAMCQWKEIRAGLWSYPTVVLCKHSLAVFKGIKGYKTYYNNCINETNNFKQLDNHVCKSEV